MPELIKYTVEHYLNEGVTTEEFEKFFQEVHLTAALPLLEKYGYVKYSVQRRDPELAAALEPMVKSVFPTWNVSKADVVIQYWLPDMGRLTQLLSDPDWSGKAVKGQERLIDISRGTVHVGHDTVYLEDGKIVKV